MPILNKWRLSQRRNLMHKNARSRLSISLFSLTHDDRYEIDICHHIRRLRDRRSLQECVTLWPRGL